MEVKFLPRESGIYFIQNISNKKMYIGSSVNIVNRLWKHRAELRGNYHPNRYLQNAWDKYSEDLFVCGVLELVDKSNLTIREQFFVDTLKPEYNLITDVIRNALSQESRAKVSATVNKLWKDGLLVSSSNKKVYQYSLEGKFLEEFESIEKAANTVGCHRCTIDRAIHGQPGKNIKTGAGYQWRLQKYEELDSIEESRKRFQRFCRALDKQEELLETPEVDNQQPS